MVNDPGGRHSSLLGRHHHSGVCSLTAPVCRRRRGNLRDGAWYRFDGCDNRDARRLCANARRAHRRSRLASNGNGGQSGRDHGGGGHTASGFDLARRLAGRRRSLLMQEGVRTDPVSRPFAQQAVRYARFSASGPTRAGKVAPPTPSSSCRTRAAVSSLSASGLLPAHHRGRVLQTTRAACRRLPAEKADITMPKATRPPAHAMAITGALAEARAGSQLPCVADAACRS